MDSGSSIMKTLIIFNRFALVGPSAPLRSLSMAFGNRCTHLLLSLACITLAAWQPASAQGHSARFKFAPNVWRVEGPRYPATHSATPLHNVRQGSVPSQGATFLGVHPQILEKPRPAVAPAPAQTRVAARTAVPAVTPQVSTPRFNPAFGNPGSLNKPVVASAPPAASLAQAAKASPASIPKVDDSPAARIHTTRHVRGKLKARPQPAQPMVAEGKAKPEIASYGKNAGYIPGPYLPAASGSGTRATATVTGKLMKN